MTTAADRVADHNAGRHKRYPDRFCSLCAGGEAKVPAPAGTAHLHQACRDAGDCSGNGWCYAYTCDPVPPEGIRTKLPAQAPGRCLACRRKGRR